MAKPRYLYDSRLRPIAVCPLRHDHQKGKGWCISIAIINKYGRNMFASVMERFPNSGHTGTAYFSSEAEARSVMKVLGLDKYPEEA